METPDFGDKITFIHERFKPFEVPVNSVDFIPCMSGPRYAEVLIQHQNTLHNYPDGVIGAPNSEEFVEIANRGITRIIQERDIEEIEATSALLTKYGSSLREQFIQSKFHPDATAYMAWVSKLRVLAGYSEDMQPSVVNVRMQDGSIFNSKRDFWQKLYIDTIPDVAFQNKFFNDYLFSSSRPIENKDTVMLGNYIKNLNLYSTEDVFFNVRLLSSPSMLRKVAVSQIEQILSQASSAGWERAREVKEMLDKVSDSNSINEDNVVNWLGNRVIEKLNHLVRKLTNQRYESFNIDDVHQSPLATRMIMDYVFMLDENPPDGRDRVNYLMVGQIAAKLLQQAAKLPEQEADMLQFRRSTD